ncbi:MAG: hypothetical protein AB1499_09035 [Nitrospirota bacterium]
MAYTASAVVRCPEVFGIYWLLNLYKCLAQTCSKDMHGPGQTGIMLMEYDLDAADLKLSQNLFFIRTALIDGFLQNP